MRLVEYVSVTLTDSFIFIFTKVLQRVKMFEIGMESSWIFVMSKILDKTEKCKIQTKLFYDYTKYFMKLF